MRPFLPLLCVLLVPAIAAADSPRALGRYGDWVAATHLEEGRTVCYAFTRAIVSPGDASTQLIPGRGPVVLTVAHRPAERDDVAISAGFAFRRSQTLEVDVQATRFDFYTAQRAGFARDGSAVVAAFTRGGTEANPGGVMVVDHTLGPYAIPVADQFSLRGFPSAYAAINSACPDT